MSLIKSLVELRVVVTSGFIVDESLQTCRKRLGQYEGVYRVRCI